MDGGKEAGRARGRARGRSRGNVAQEQERRPGQAAAAAAPPPPQQVPASVGQLGRQMEEVSIKRTGNGNGNGVNVGRGTSRGARTTVFFTRPEQLNSKQGNFGQKVSLVANYFKLKSRPGWAICQYRVDFRPEVDRIGQKKALLRIHKEKLGESKEYLFDGTMLFTARQLPEQVELYSKRESDDATIQITIKRTNKVSPQDLKMLQILNLLMKRCMFSLGLQLVGRNYYNMEGAIKVPHYKLDILPGYATAIASMEREIMMMTSVSHKIMRQETALDVLMAAKRNARGDARDEAMRALLGSIVLTNYNNKTYRVDDIDFTVNCKHTFEKRTRDGPVRISYMQYYETQYGVKIRDPNQPLLVTRPKRVDRQGEQGIQGPIYLIPELCTITGITDEMRSDFRVMRDLATHTRLTPDQRVATLDRLRQDIGRSREVNEAMQQWQLSFEPNLLKLQGRLLPPEKVLFGSGQGEKSYTYTVDNADWTRGIRDTPLDQPVTLKNWLVFFPERFRQVASQYVQTMNRVCGAMRIQLSQPQLIPLENDRTQLYANALRSNVRPGVDFVVCIVSNDNRERYEAIKKELCINIPVPSQVLKSRTLDNPKNLMSVVTKVALQINCKAGGLLWHLVIPFKSPVMVIGYDSYHDSKKKGTSVGAFISSMNRDFTKYFNQVNFHSGREELSNHFTTYTRNALQKFHERNKVLPDMVFVYRDGLSESQIQYCFENEVAKLKACLEQQSGKKINLAFIVVTKRINTRFFEAGNRGFTNPCSGTIVDDHVTKAESFDFYLVSQSVRQGTVGPTHYNVISDSTGLSPDIIQRLTYKMTHLYYNWPGTVRVPAPCQYAHKLAFLVGQHLHAHPHQSLMDKFFYL